MELGLHGDDGDDPRAGEHVVGEGLREVALLEEMEMTQGLENVWWEEGLRELVLLEKRRHLPVLQAGVLGFHGRVLVAGEGLG